MSKQKKVILAIILVVVVAVMIFINLRKQSTGGLEISAVEVKRGDITRTISGSGQVQPEMEVDISARISAEITSIHVEEGETVNKGKLLVELDRQRYEAAVEQAESSKLSALAALKKARADFSRINDLYKKDLTSQADLDAAEAQLMSAESQVKQAEAYLKQAMDDLRKTRLISPIYGTVVKVYKEEGEIAVGSQFQSDPILNVADLNRMEVLAEIDENDVVYVKIDDKCNIEVDAIPDTFFNGRVSEIAHMATTRGLGTQEQVTNFEVKVAVTSPVEQLRPGMSATVDIMTETHHDILYVPIQCVTVREVKKDSADVSAKRSSEEKESDSEGEEEEKKEEKTEVVFVVEEGIANVRPVKTGISDDTNIEIVSGLQEDEMVVSGSYKALSRLLKDGSEVKVNKDIGYRKDELD
ncbi:efflux RND transporter periplasmic adaptor subunit [candidate division KSB1 bacterium]|nr:efflux RND transporter periplasmic adaptor subunit [candidate division KSB1 bacterium]